MRALACLFALIWATHAGADDWLGLSFVQLLQPESVLGERTSADELADYIQRTESAVRETIRASSGSARSGYLILAVRAGGRRKAWTDFDPADASDAAIIRAVEALTAPKVSHGTVLIALALQIRGGAAPERRVPSPPAWQAVMQERNETFSLEQVVEIVWPMSEAEATSRPEFEYVEEALDGLGATIERPRDWHVARTTKGWPTWTISLEDTADGHGYQTGMRVQWLSPIREITGQTPKQLVEEFIKSRKANANKVIDCGEQEAGSLTRACLETVEGDFHILYSMFYANPKADFAIIITTGAPIDLWERYAPVFARMAALRFDAGAAAASATD